MSRDYGGKNLFSHSGIIMSLPVVKKNQNNAAFSPQKCFYHIYGNFDNNSL